MRNTLKLPILCPNDNCNQLIKNEEKLEKHLMYRCHPMNTLQHLNILHQKSKKHPNQMTNMGVPSKNIITKQGLAKYDTQTKKWTCMICGKEENPQDYANMERHIWWHRERQKRHDDQIQEQLRPPLTPIQIIRIATLLLLQNDQRELEIIVHETSPPETTQNTHTTDAVTLQTPTLWELLQLIVWDKGKNEWQCNINDCSAAKEQQSNITGRQSKVHKETWEHTARTP